jgi:hypothetical protein
MLTKKLNGTIVGSGTQIDFTATGASATDDGSTTTYDFSKLVNYVEVAITAAQMKALRATPKPLVAAPGTGYVLEFISALFIYDYTAAFTESADDIAVKYTDGSGATASTTLDATGLLDATSDQIRTLKAISTDITPVANAALVLHNTGDGEWGGTGSPCRVKVAYRVHATGL